MQIGYIGLGKMGYNMCLRLLEKGWEVIAYDPQPEARESIASHGAHTAGSIQNFVKTLPIPRLIWLMVPHKAVDEVVHTILPLLEKGDSVIDGGNSLYKESMRRAKELEKKGIDFLDVGVSGGPAGARNGACVMVGGKEEVFTKFKKLFNDISVKDGYAYVGKSGAGHFVKMVHNGIEYGMMQSLAEGFTLLKASPFTLDLGAIAVLYNHGSVIESRLVDWLKTAFQRHTQELSDVSGSVEQSGEGLWTVEAGKEYNVDVSSIDLAVAFREVSKTKPSYTGKLLTATRNQFGGHAVK